MNTQFNILNTAYRRRHDVISALALSNYVVCTLVEFSNIFAFKKSEKKDTNKMLSSRAVKLCHYKYDT